MARSTLCLLSAVVSSFLCTSVSGSKNIPHGSDFAASLHRPPNDVRPFFRYWLPDASVDGGVLAKDIASSQAIGAGGVELVAFYNYGGYGGNYPKGADWARFNFGTKPFNELFNTALKAHKDLGLKMDFALGPNQGQGVPADPADDGLQWDLVCDLLFTIPI